MHWFDTLPQFSGMRLRWEISFSLLKYTCNYPYTLKQKVSQRRDFDLCVHATPIISKEILTEGEFWLGPHHLKKQSSQKRDFDLGLCASHHLKNNPPHRGIFTHIYFLQWGVHGCQWISMSVHEFPLVPIGVHVHGCLQVSLDARSLPILFL